MVQDIANHAFRPGQTAAQAAKPTGEAQHASTAKPANEAETQRAEKQEAAEQAREVPKASLNELVAKLNERMQDIRRELQFSVDDDTGKVVIKVLNAETEEVVRQIPPEEVLSLAANLEANGGSLLVDATA